jgi:predicted secreted hydrolase
MKHITKWLPWLLLLIVITYCIFAPVRGLIGPVQLPEDDAFLPDEDVQWWYWTGHLQTKEGREFGFEVVFFTFDSFLIMQDQLVQVAITDIQNNKFHFKEYIKLHLPDRSKNSFNLSAGDNGEVKAIGGNGKDQLHAEVDGFVFDLNLEATKPVAMHYGGDAHPYVFGGYTYYYSRPHMKTSGSISINGKNYQVTGTSWFDRQYGELYQAIIQGWQWFAIELEDNRQIMLYDIRGKQASVEKSGSITDAKGNTRVLAAHEFDVKILDHWISPNTGCKYPSGWEVSVDGIKMLIQPTVKDQELRASHDFWAGPEYWEGDNRVSGDISGKAYVELNGYCRGVEGTIKP